MMFEWNSDLAGNHHRFTVWKSPPFCVDFVWTFLADPWCLLGFGVWSFFQWRKQIWEFTVVFPIRVTFLVSAVPTSTRIIYLPTFNAVVSLLHFMILSLRIPTQIRDPQIALDMTAPTDLLHLLWHLFTGLSYSSFRMLDDHHVFG